jgi:hypothetical protein
VKQIAAREAISLLTTMTRVLCAVGILALVFTTANVTRFATGRGVSLPIACLLDPMIGTALAGVLYVDARLASWGINPPAWSTTLRWGAGCTAALMNTWESLWPDGQIGWPRRADPAAVLIHLTPALLLIALTETIAAYRRTITDLLDRIGSADPTDPSAPPAAPTPRSGGEPSDRDTAGADPPDIRPPPNGSAPHPAATDTPATGRKSRADPHTGSHTPRSHPPATEPRPVGDRATHADVWPRAITLDDAARATTGKPVTVWKLRTELRIGPRRARQIRDQLLALHTEPPTPNP